ncbi:MAG: hypothetical protein MRY57_01305 [Candidatus Pacebacteria bacterium]|nr:hypothetical protein [Candidatus Paceibacterota bacterium]
MEGIPKINKEQKNELHSAHLKNPDLAIMTCVGTKNQHRNEEGVLDIELQKLLKNSDVINFHAPVEELNENNIENSGEQTFVISNLNENSKWSANFLNCTGVIAVGKNKETGNSISFITHQDPGRSKFLDEDKGDFNTIFRDRLDTLKELSEEGTIDVVIAGGNYMIAGRNREKFQNDYQNSIQKLTEMVNEKLGFNPIIASGPKVQEGKDDFVFDTENRRLYLSRNHFTQFRKVNKAYHPDDFEKEKENWSERNR